MRGGSGAALLRLSEDADDDDFDSEYTHDNGSDGEGKDAAPFALDTLRPPPARRRSVKSEVHPQRQSTPRRRLREAQLADRVFSTDDDPRDGPPLLTPRLMRSQSFAESDSRGAAATGADCSSARVPGPARPPAAAVAAIAATAREVATASLLAGARNVAMHARRRSGDGGGGTAWQASGAEAKRAEADSMQESNQS